MVRIEKSHEQVQREEVAKRDGKSESRITTPTTTHEVTEVHTTRMPAPTTVEPVRKRFSWGAIFAGLITAMTVLILLSVLGMAVGFSAIDAGDTASSFGIGAGIWGAIAAIIAFFVGGWMASWARPSVREGNGVLQGALVWMLSLVLITYVLTTSVTGLLGTATDVAATGVEAAASGADVVVAPGETVDVQAQASDAIDAVQGKIQDIRENITPQEVENVAASASTGAWWTLVSLLVTLGAAMFGGFLGSTKS